MEEREAEITIISDDNKVTTFVIQDVDEEPDKLYLKYLNPEDNFERLYKSIDMQFGPRFGNKNVNGFLDEDVLAYIKLRLEWFQEHNMACEENAKAIEHLTYAINALKDRKGRRIAVGTEGTYNGN